MAFYKYKGKRIRASDNYRRNYQNGKERKDGSAGNRRQR